MTFFQRTGLRWRRIGITPVSLVPFFAPVLVLVVFGLAYANTKPLLYRNGTLFRHWDCSSSVPVSDEVRRAMYTRAEGVGFSSVSTRSCLLICHLYRRPGVPHVQDQPTSRKYAREVGRYARRSAFFLPRQRISGLTRPAYSTT